MSRRALPTLEERYDRTVAAVYQHRQDLLSPQHGHSCGVFVRSTSRFFAGDVVIIDWHNGQGERCEVSGWSHKLSAYVGHEDRRYKGGLMVQYARFAGCQLWVPATPRYNRSPLRVIVEVPAELALLWWSHPGLRPFAVSALRAAYPGPPVSTDTGGATRGGMTS